MTTELRLLAVLAHPDDESLGNGGMLVKYAAEGVKTYLVTATRGEQGWFADPKDYPGPEELGRIREGELRSAAKVLGVQEVSFLDYRDGELPNADHDEVVGKIDAKGFFSTQGKVDFPGALPMPVQFFLIWLALLMWAGSEDAATTNTNPVG